MASKLNTPAGFPANARTPVAGGTQVYTCPVTAAMFDDKAGADLDLIILGILPAGYRLTDFTLATGDELDTNGSPTLTVDIGLYSSTTDDLAADTNIAALTTTETGSATGFVVRATKGLFLKNCVNNTASDMYIIAKVTEVAATGAAGTLYSAVSIAPL